MRFALFAVSCLLFLFHCVTVDSFTVGNLLPAYICGATAFNNVALDGLPKSLASWLTNIHDAAPAIGRMTNPLLPSGATVNPAVRVDYATDQGTVENTKMLLTNWHNRASNFGCNHTIFVTTALTNHPTVTNQIVPGQNHTLTLTINGMNGNVNCDVYATQNLVTAADIANIALDGAVVYGITAGGTRVGTFVAFGANENGVTTVQPWAACGTNNIGIVHNQLISGTGQYTGIVWQAPATLVPVATPANGLAFQGAAVSDVGFGKHFSQFAISSPAALAAQGITLNVAQPIITKVAEFGNHLAVFINSQAKGAPAATNAVVIPTTFTVTVTQNGATVGTATVKQATVATVSITQAMKGQQVAVTVTASNNAGGLPTTSGTVLFTLAPGAVQKVISLDVVLALCPADQQKERAMFLQDADPDYQCAYQTQVLLDNGTVAFVQETVVASGAPQQSPALPLITLFAAAVAVAALARKI